MFTEVLRIKPILDSAAATQMETNLTTRFTRVAKRFGHGLKSVIHASLFGVSLALLAKLLNPLQAVEERIKSLLEEGSNVADFADRLNTKPGTLLQTQTIAESLGVKPEDFKKLVTSFATAIENARDQLKTGEGIHTPEAVAVKNFLPEKDLLQGFTAFIAALKAQTNPEERRKIEKAVFGEQQFGTAKNFLNANLEKAGAKLPDAVTFQKAANKADKLSSLQEAIAAKNKAENFITAANQTTPGVVAGIEASKQRDEAKTLKQIPNAEVLLAAKKTLDGLAEIMQSILDVLLQILGYFQGVTKSSKQISESRAMRGVPGVTKGDY